MLSEEGKGLDLSTYDSVTINMDYEGQDNPRFRFYIRNYDERYSVKGDAMSNKFNRLDFSLPDASLIDLDYFNVPFWWNFSRLQTMQYWFILLIEKSTKPEGHL